MTVIPKKVQDIVKERADGRCEGCGAYADTELHHRQFRARGGAHAPQNLLALCGWGNHTGCHGIAHSGTSESPGEGTRLGWAVTAFADPLWVPVYLFDDWYLLTPEGLRHRISIPSGHGLDVN